MPASCRSPIRGSARTGSCLCVLSFIALPLSSRALSVLKAESLDLKPNQAGQMITFYLENQDSSPLALGGMDLALQVGDGAPDKGLKPEKPRISNVELINGTVFGGYTPLLFIGPGNQPYRQSWSVTVPALGSFPELPANSHLPVAVVEFDTTDLFRGTYSLSLKGSAAGDSGIFDSFGLPLLDSTISNFELKISPTGEAVPDSPLGISLLFAVYTTLRLASRLGRN